jgi:hypothetical protein
MDKLEYFALPVNFLALVAGTAANLTVQTPSDAEWWWNASHYMADIAAAGQTDSSRVVPLVTLLVNDGFTGRNLSSNVVAQNGIPLSSMFGGREPMPLGKPLQFAPNSFITISVFNYDAANTYNLRMALIGYKRLPA